MVYAYHMWRSGDNFVELTLFPYLYMGSREQAQVTRLQLKPRSLLSRLTAYSVTFS